MYAGEILCVHLEDARDEDAARIVVDTAVPLVGEELLGGPLQCCAQAGALVCRRPYGRAAVRAAVDGEVNARLGELPAQNLVLDVVEADGATAGHMTLALEELAVACLPHRGDWILRQDRVQGEGIVG